MSVVDGDTPVNALALRSGALVHSRFRVLRSLGAPGAHALTYFAQDERDRERVVLRELLPRGLARREGNAVRAHTDADARELARAARRFLREGEILADLSHPALPRVRAAFETNGTAYIVVRQYEVIPLARYLAQSPEHRLPVARAVELMTPILEALELVHAEGVIHREISPDTIHVETEKEGQPILLGWPAHRHLSGGAPHQLAAGYAALEQYGGRGVGPWTDVHACAALLYHLLTGIVPPSAVDRAATEELLAPITLVPTIPPPLSALIVRAMSQVPEQRPHGAGELRRLIATAASSAGAVAPPPQSLGELLSAERFATPTPQRDEAQRATEYADIAATLRLTAGVVVPEEHGMVDRVRVWFGALGMAKGGRAEAPAFAPTAAAPTVAAVLAPGDSAGARHPERLASSSAAPSEEVVPRVAGEQPPLVEGRIATRRTPPMQRWQEPSRRRSRVMTSVTVILVLAAIAGGAAYAYRRLHLAGNTTPTGASNPANTGEPARMQPALMGGQDSTRLELDSGGTLRQQGSLERSVSIAGERVRNPRVAGAGRVMLPTVQTVSLPIAAPTASALLPAEVDAALRDRLSAGRGLADAGQYAAARATFQASLRRIDSLAISYGSSQALRTMRSTLEQETRRALDACNAENEIRTKRGAQPQPCG